MTVDLVQPLEGIKGRRCGRFTLRYEAGAEGVPELVVVTGHLHRSQSAVDTGIDLVHSTGLIGHRTSSSGSVSRSSAV